MTSHARAFGKAAFTGGIPITDALAIAPQLKGSLDQSNKAVLIALSVRAGIGKAGFDDIAKEPLEDRIELIGSYGKAQAEHNDLAGAWETAKIVDALYTQLASNDSTPLLAAGFTVNGAKRDAAFWNIGGGLVAGGDFGHASVLAAHMGNDMSYFALASTIAIAQYQAGDLQGAKKTLDEIRGSLTAPGLYDPNNFAFSLSAETFALCGDITGARQIVEGIKPPLRHDAVYSRLAQALAHAGDMTHAREMADAAGDNADDFIAIGKAQADKGDFGEARKTLMAARDANARDLSRNKLDRESELFRIFGGQLYVGAYSEAVASAMAIEPATRQQFLIQAIAEEAKHKDDKALRDTVSAAMKTAKDTSPAGSAVKAYADLAEILAKNGYKVEAKAAVTEAQNLMDRLLPYDRIASWKTIRRTQRLLGDDAGAAITAEKLAKDRQQANSLPKLEAGSGGTDERSAKVLEVVKLLQHSDNDNQEHSQATLQRAMAVLGKDAQLLEPLIFMTAGFQRNSPPFSTVDDLIEEHKFSEAMASIQSTGGMRKDGLLGTLAQAEAMDGQWKLAFDTAKTINDPSARTTALQGLLSAKSTDVKK